MDGKDHYRAGEHCLSTVAQIIAEAGNDGIISTANKTTMDMLATLGTMHFAAATSHALNFGTVATK